MSFFSSQCAQMPPLLGGNGLQTLCCCSANKWLAFTVIPALSSYCRNVVVVKLACNFLFSSVWLCLFSLLSLPQHNSHICSVLGNTAWCLVIYALMSFRVSEPPQETSIHIFGERTLVFWRNKLLRDESTRLAVKSSRVLSFFFVQDLASVCIKVGSPEVIYFMLLPCRILESYLTPTAHIFTRTSESQESPRKPCSTWWQNNLTTFLHEIRKLGN